MTSRDTERDAIIDAACVWAGAQQVLDEYRHDPSVTADELAAIAQRVHAHQGKALLAAVDTYLTSRRLDWWGR